MRSFFHLFLLFALLHFIFTLFFFYYTLFYYIFFVCSFFSFYLTFFWYWTFYFLSSFFLFLFVGALFCVGSFTWANIYSSTHSFLHRIIYWRLNLSCTQGKHIFFFFILFSFLLLMEFDVYHWAHIGLFIHILVYLVIHSRIHFSSATLNEKTHSHPIAFIFFYIICF